MSVFSHLRLEVFEQLLQLILVPALLRPADAQTFLLVRLRYHVHVYVIDDLVC